MQFLLGARISPPKKEEYPKNEGEVVDPVKLYLIQTTPA